jgi:hypothetical protein
MPHRFPFPSAGTFLFQITLVILLVSFSHCKKKEDTPPVPKVAETPVAAPAASPPAPTPAAASSATAPAEGQGMNDCCVIGENPDMKGRLGRVVVAFPNGAVPKDTRVDVLKDGKVVQGGYGNQSWELLSGAYEVSISGKRIGNVTVKPGHDTTVKVGVLRVSAGKDTRVDVLDIGNKLTGGYGNQVIGLPPGSFNIQVAGQSERVTISEGQVTDF